MEDQQNTIGAKIKEQIKIKKSSIKEVAEKLKITTQGLYQILNKGRISIDYLIKIASVLDVDPCEFFSLVVDCKNENRTFDNKDYKKYYSNDAKIVIGNLSIENHELKRKVELLKNQIYSLTNDD